MGYNLLPFLVACSNTLSETFPLLLYTHIPAMCLSALFGFYVLYNTRTLQAVVLCLLSVTFILWTFADITVWVFYDRPSLQIAIWSLFGLLTAFTFFFTHWFIQLYLSKTTPDWLIYTWGLLLTPIIMLTPTGFNVKGIDSQVCAVVENNAFTNYYYFLGLVATLLIFFSTYQWYRDSITDTRAERNGKWIVIVSGLLFIFAFVFTGTLDSYLVSAGFLPDFGLEMYGVATMSFFIGMLAYATVQYGAFNLKLVAAQALVVALVVSVGSEFLFVSSEMAYVLVGCSLFLISGFGYLLVRSVNAEIKARAEVEKLSQEKSEFMAFASHEIRNPITAMRGYASLITDGTTGETNKDTTRAANQILLTGDDVLRLISQFLDRSKMELGQIAYSIAPFDIGLAVSQVADGFRPHAADRGLQFSATTPSVMTKGDLGKFKEVLGNILDNSLKYTRTGSISVAVSEHDGKVRATVSDTGVGIPPEVLPKLFQKFARADAQKANLLGTGLGLYLGRTFIEGMGGKVWAESEGKDKGSRFIIELDKINLT